MTASATSLRLHTRSYVVIPARTASTRLPRKLLLRETGRTVLEHTHAAACRASRPLGVFVAAGDQEILDEVQRFGGRGYSTDPAAATGTDRVAEVARTLSDAEIVVNVQGDEPEMDPTDIDRVIRLLEGDPEASVATLAVPIRRAEALHDPACVKVVVDRNQRALYFSRSCIPHVRDPQQLEAALAADPPRFLQHVGLYAYRREFLLSLGQLPPTPLEDLEKLEQLRFLAAGCVIRVGITNHRSRGIDTWDDYRAFVTRQANC